PGCGAFRLFVRLFGGWRVSVVRGGCWGRFVASRLLGLLSTTASATRPPASAGAIGLAAFCCCVGCLGILTRGRTIGRRSFIGLPAGLLGCRRRLAVGFSGLALLLLCGALIRLLIRGRAATSAATAPAAAGTALTIGRGVCLVGTTTRVGASAAGAGLIGLFTCLICGLRC